MNRLRIKAEKLRDNGYSYNMIAVELGIAKSTLSNWFSDKPFVPNREVLKRIQYGPIKSAERAHNKKVREIETLLKVGAKELGSLNKRDLWLLGLGVYIGEGSKTHDNVRIINADPMVIKLSLKWFRDIIGLSNDNISIRLHLYPDNNQRACVKFWKQATLLPVKNFEKIQIDRRLGKANIRKNKLPFGTAHISIRARGNNIFGVKLSRRIKGWMHGAFSQI